MTDQPRILPDLTATDLLAKLAEMQAEIERLRNAQPQTIIRFKTQPSGCVTILGLTNPKYSPTLYPKVWKGIIAKVKELDAYIDAGLANGTLSLEKRTD